MVHVGFVSPMAQTEWFAN